MRVLIKMVSFKLERSVYFVGWIAKIKLSNQGEVDKLMDEAAYVKHTSK